MTVRGWFVSGLIAVIAAVTLATAAIPTRADAGTCTVTCYKHPITGQKICTPPCP
ncbi:MAG: hypothetical protein ABMB14_20095 [Myxococcota bacterium]